MAFAGSNASTSINFQLISHTTSLIDTHEIQLLNMANYTFPMYSSDREEKDGFPDLLITFKGDIEQSDGLIIGVNEHNGGASAYFKNLLDWLSRLDRRFLQEKKIILLATSPGKGGGARALEAVATMLPHFGGTVMNTFSLPSFASNFTAENGIIDAELAAAHKKVLQQFLDQI